MQGNSRRPIPSTGVCGSSAPRSDLCQGGRYRCWAVSMVVASATGWQPVGSSPLPAYACMLAWHSQSGVLGGGGDGHVGLLLIVEGYLCGLST